MSVGEGNVLLANDQPFISAEGDGFFANITTPNSYQVPWRRGDNGEGIIPTPSEIEEMKATGEGKWVEPLPLSHPLHHHRISPKKNGRCKKSCINWKKQREESEDE